MMRIRYMYICLISILCMTLLTSCSGITKDEKKYREEGIEYINSEQYDLAIQSFDKALSSARGDSIDKEEIDILKYRAEAEYKAGDYKAAEHTYELLCTYDKELNEYDNLRVICLAKSGEDLDKAVTLYSSVEEQDSHSTGHDDALYILGSSLVATGQDEDIEQAMTLYQEALSDKKRKHPELYNRVGMLYAQKEDYDTALTWFNDGLTLIGEQKEADTVLKQAIDYNIASCYEYKQEYDKALELFEQYLASYGEDADVKHEIAFLQSRIR